MSKKRVTGDLLLALKVLADLSTRYRTSGVPYPYKNWNEGIRKLKESYPDKYKLIFKDYGYSITNVKATWVRLQNAAFGFCAGKGKEGTGCKEKIDLKENIFYCKNCKPKALYYRGIYSNPAVKNNRAEVKKAVHVTKESILREIAEKYIMKFSLEDKKRILGEEYVKAVQLKK